MYLNRNDENIALQLQYSNILLTKSLTQLIKDSAGIVEFSIFGDEEGEFFIVPDSEKVDLLSESHHTLAHLVGEALFQEHPINTDNEVYSFRIEFENEDDEDYESTLSVIVLEMEDEPELELEEVDHD